MKTHGLSKIPEYRVWADMKTRCLNPNDTAYRYYGGRGISVCRRWMKFENFYKDMGSKPSPAHTIERINGNGNYTPRNCRWATRREQMNNLRRNRRLTYQKRKLTVSQWSRELGIPRGRIFNRLSRNPKDPNPLGPVREGRFKKGHHLTPTGERSHLAKITDSQEMEIRLLLSQGMTPMAIFKLGKFNISASAIAKIKTGHSRRHRYSELTE